MNEVAIEGSDILAAQLLALPDKVRKAVEKASVKASKEVIAGQMKSNAPVDSGALQQSITSVVRSYKGGRIVLGFIGPEYSYTGVVTKNKQGQKVLKKVKKNKGEAGIRRPANYAHLVELGTVQRTTQSGANRGSVAPNNFTQKTAEEVTPQVQTILENAVSEALNQL
ncbi:MAG: HK97 gp10 family phage protein [Planctomycetaceae bacterium]|jgi:HK97 gp10 family phage protein|nr:HK97 gp10 family phage protein [Planctomycetaceae bacterium]